jgi:AcrR family transcriptional regulator
MPRPRKVSREEKLIETRQRLLKAAATEFSRDGYVGANINRISNAAGFAKGTIYNHFPSKRALMLALIDHIATAHVDSILEQVEPIENATQKLQQLFSAGFLFVENHPNKAAVIINAVYGPDREFRQRIFQAYDKLFSLMIEDILGRGIACGEFRPVDPDLAAAVLMSIYLGACSLIEGDGQVGFASDQFVTFILEGLRRRDPTRDIEEQGQ